MWFPCTHPVIPGTSGCENALEDKNKTWKWEMSTPRLFMALEQRTVMLVTAKDRTMTQSSYADSRYSTWRLEHFPAAAVLAIPAVARVNKDAAAVDHQSFLLKDDKKGESSRVRHRP